jgi:SagB-type dehydrogenase family enzyme
VYPEIIKTHEAAKTVQESDSPHSDRMESLGIGRPSDFKTLPPPDPAAALMNYPESVFKRRSKRNFISEPIKTGQLNYLLSLLCRAAEPSIHEHPDMASAVAVGFIAGNIRGLEPGFYLLDSNEGKFGKIFSGFLTGKMAEICLDQAWLKNAGVQFVFMSNLEGLARKWGARGYRYAMLTAGRMGHAVYLGATALGLGCCGIGAFYDGEARGLLGLNDASAMLYLVGVGRVKG